MYSTGKPTTDAASVHFAHRSRRLTIRTVSQTQNAVKTTPRIDRAMSMRGFYSKRSGLVIHPVAKTIACTTTSHVKMSLTASQYKLAADRAHKEHCEFV